MKLIPDEIAMYLEPGSPPDWRSLLEACHRSLHHYGINQRLWGDFKRALGIGVPDTDPAVIWAAVLEDGRSYDLVRGLRLRRSSVMGGFRVELAHNEANPLTDRLVALGCISEIIAYQRRVFVPVSEDGPAVLKRVLEVLPFA